MVGGAVGVAKRNAVEIDAEIAVGKTTQRILDAAIGQSRAVEIGAGHAGRDGQNGGVGASRGDRVLNIGFADDGLRFHRVERGFGRRCFRIEGCPRHHQGFDFTGGGGAGDVGGVGGNLLGHRRRARKDERQNGGGIAQPARMNGKHEIPLALKCKANASRQRNRPFCDPALSMARNDLPRLYGALVPCLFDDAVTVAIRKINLTATYGPVRRGLVNCHPTVTE